MDRHTLILEKLPADLAAAWWGGGPLLDANQWPIEEPDPAWIARAQAELARRLGCGQVHEPQAWKSGGPSREAALGHAALPPRGVRHSPATLHDLRLNRPGIEAEIALRLGQDVDAARAATLDGPQAAALVDGMAVSAELVSSRWLQAQAAPAWLRQVDALSHGALVLGDWLPPQAGRDWAQQACEIQRNEDAPLRARGSHSLGDPFWLLPQWLRHATREGQVLPAGSVVTTGAWLVMPDLAAGDRLWVRFEGLGEVQVQL